MGTKIEITQAQMNHLFAAIEKNRRVKGPLMPTLHDAQKIFGCIPLPIQKVISKELEVSVSEINGVVTFYSQFSTEPKGKHVISVCMGTACYVRGAQELLNAISHDIQIKPGETSLDGKFTLDATRCIGACGLAPIFTVGEEVYGNTSVAKARDVIKKYVEAA